MKYINNAPDSVTGSVVKFWHWRMHAMLEPTSDEWTLRAPRKPKRDKRMRGRYERERRGLTFSNLLGILCMAGIIGLSIGCGIVAVLNVFGY